MLKSIAVVVASYLLSVVLVFATDPLLSRTSIPNSEGDPHSKVRSGFGQVRITQVI